jgi:hypothetical protein
MTHIAIEKEKLEQVLDALECATRYGAGGFEYAKDSIKQALAAPVQPVAWTLLLVGAHNGLVGKAGEKFLSNPEHYQRVDVYTAPPAAQPAVPDAIHHTDLSEHPQIGRAHV